MSDPRALQEIEELYVIWKDLKEDDLLTSYKEAVPESIIRGLSAKERIKLRNFLHDRGIDVKKGSGERIIDVLENLLPEKTIPVQSHHKDTNGHQRDTVMYANSLLKVYSYE